MANKSSKQKKASKKRISQDQSGISRRQFLAGAAAGAAALAAPTLWIPRKAIAQTAIRGSVKHLLYIRLGGGFRFTTAFNGDVASEFNPFGRAGGVPAGTEWGVGDLLKDAPFLDGDEGELLVEAGMAPVHEFANEIAVIPCVDHEPLAQSADGGHSSALERFLTGYFGGDTSFFTMVNFGLKDKVDAALGNGQTLLPAISFGDAGMARGFWRACRVSSTRYWGRWL